MDDETKYPMEDPAEEALGKVAFSDKLLDAQNDTVFLFDPLTSKPIRWNASFSEISGYSEDEIALMSAPDDFYDKENLEKAKVAMAKIALEGKGTIEIDLLTKHGELVPFEYSVSSITDRTDRTLLLSIGRNITERRQTEQALETLVDATASNVGQEFFESMVTRISKWLNCECAIFSEIQKDGKANAVAMTLKGRMIRDYSYALANTPCNTAICKGFCVYPEGVTELFPEDADLVEMDAEGYVGTSVQNRDGIPIGILCGISLDALVLPPNAEKVLKIVGTRLGAEIERRQAEKALAKSEEQFRTVVEQSTEAIEIYDIQGRLLIVNDAWAKFWNLERTAVADFNIFDDPQCEMTGLTPAFREAQSGRSTVVPDVSYDPEDSELAGGRVRWISPRVYPIKDRTGTVQNIILTYSDITERKQTEEALRESEERFRLMAEQTGLMVYDYKIQTGRIDWSGAITEITGFEADEFQRTCIDEWKEAIHPDDRKATVLQIDEALTNVTPYKMEYRFRRRSKSYIYVEDCGNFLADDAGRAYRMIGNMKDITERRSLEEQLRQSEKMLAVGQLAGGIAHDFNNQLGGIVGFSDMLLLKLKDEKLRHYAKGIMKAAERSAMLTAQLLAFGRKGKHLLVPVSIHEMLVEVHTLLRHSIDKRIKIREFLNADHATVVGDPNQIQNALLNIALNGRDAMPQGGELTLATEAAVLDLDFCKSHSREIRPGPYVKISIIDTGIGMDAETQRHIFEPFFTTKGVGEGTGMGLSSAYGIIRNHAGLIDVYSESGHGTVFRVYLPLAPNEADTQEPVLQSPPITGVGRILLVDDEETVRDSAEHLLDELGYDVVFCKDGKEAVKYYVDAYQEIDLVILDMVMPEMNGKEAFIAMREINPSVKAILSSGYSINGEAQAILDEGVMAFVGKPYRLLPLSKAIAQVLGEMDSSK